MHGGRKKVKDAPRGVSGDGLRLVGLLGVMPGPGPELTKEGEMTPYLTLALPSIAFPGASQGGSFGGFGPKKGGRGSRGRLGASRSRPWASLSLAPAFVGLILPSTLPQVRHRAPQGSQF
jgi:hypothetical protein